MKKSLLALVCAVMFSVPAMAAPSILDTPAGKSMLKEQAKQELRQQAQQHVQQPFGQKAPVLNQQPSLPGKQSLKGAATRQMQRDEKGRFLPAAAKPGVTKGALRAKKGSGVFHRPGCRYYESAHDFSFKTPAEAGKKGFRPCKVCGK